MSDAKQASKRKRRGRTAPLLGAAGLSLSLVSGAPAATGGPAADVLTRSFGVTHGITLAEEEISDVSLATFHIFDREAARTFQGRGRLAMGACGGGCGGGCGGCGCWTGADYGASATGGDAGPRHHSIKPAHKYTHAPKRARDPKKP